MKLQYEDTPCCQCVDGRGLLEMAGVHLCVRVQCCPSTVVSKVSYTLLSTFNEVYSSTWTSDQVSFYNMNG